MSIDLKKSDVLFLLGALVLIPIVLAAPTSQTFTVSLILGNNDPVVEWIEAGGTYAPTEANTRNITFMFNVSDADGYENINMTPTMVATYNGLIRQGTCENIENYSSYYATFNCTVNLEYYDNASAAWYLNFTVRDINAGADTNESETFTYDTLDAIRLTRASLSFSASGLGVTDLAATDNPLQVNNTGNVDFAQINVTAYDLVGNETGERIGAGNFTVNVTSAVAGAGQILTSADDVAVGDAVLNHGQNANEQLYFWIDVPSSGLPAQKYNSSAWVLSVYQ